MNISLKIYAICCVILFIKMFAIGITQGLLKKKYSSFVVVEDAKMMGLEPATSEPLPLVRANNAFRNDLENIPMFLFLALVYVMLNCWDRGSLIYFTTFVFARIMHSIFYINGKQPWRSMSYGIGLLMSFIISGHIIYQVFTK
ncbi:MAG: MAPEG family protein [Candidatus Sericytochromatia bacterium]